MGFDLDKSVIETAKKNIETTKLEDIRVEVQDLFDNSPTTDTITNTNTATTTLPLTSTKPVVIVNPPYGKRVEADIELPKYYSDMLQAIDSKHQPFAIGIIIPQYVSISKLKIPKGFKKLSVLSFENGGIKVNFATFWRP